MAKLDTDQDEISEVLDNCNDTIALLGHANKQINLSRRYFMKPDLDANYVHLCAQSVPYTSYLFGDDVSKAAKDIEDTRKIGSRLGGYRGRPFYRGGRGRGFRRGFPGILRGRRGGYHGGFTYRSRNRFDDSSKNFRRGGLTSGRGH
jgi:hypothetical protein